MALKDELRLIVNEYGRLAGIGGTQGAIYARDYSRRSYESTIGILEHNRVLFDIFEGDLLTYVLADLREYLSKEYFEQVKGRVAPINVLKRIIDKLSKIYADCPERKIEAGSEKDQKLLDWYVSEMDLNTNMSSANEFFNLFKTCALEPCLHDGKPMLRALPSDRFFVMSLDPINPTKPTHFIKIMGALQNPEMKDKTMQRTLLYVYTDTEFLAIDDHGSVVQEVMQRIENPDGVNPFGKIPFIYINRSRHDIIPKPDSDTLQMTKLIPVLLSDINAATLFQCSSIIYGIDLDQEGLKMSPNAFWSFKSDPNSDKKPSVGVLKPEVDTDKVINLIRTQLTFWMQSRNIKPGAMGALGPENLSSGFAKVIDEMDTSEDRKKQVPFFIDAEKQLFDLIVTYMHPVWQQDPDFEMRGLSFSPGVKITASFPDQEAVADPSVQIDNVIKRMGAGIESKRGALRELNPDWTDQQLDDKLEEIAEENSKAMEEMQTQMQTNGGDLNGQETSPEDAGKEDASQEGSTKEKEVSGKGMAKVPTTNAGVMPKQNPFVKA